MHEFGRAFVGADVLMMTDIYPAGEDPIPGITLDALASAVQSDFKGALSLVPALYELPAALAATARPGDLVVLLGAGSIGSIAASVVHALQEGR
jgi:UDP-N-acetylmuramate--alanine ligase